MNPVVIMGLFDMAHTILHIGIALVLIVVGFQAIAGRLEQK